MQFYWLILGVLGVWRVTHLLHAEDGPWDLLVKWRKLFGGGVVGRMLDCFYCASVWVAIPFAWGIGRSWKERLLLWPALSGAASLLERVAAGRQPTAAYFEEETEESSDVLRTESSRGLPADGAEPSR